MINKYFLQNRFFYTSGLIAIIINVFILSFVIFPDREKAATKRREYITLRKAKVEAEKDYVKSKDYSSRLEILKTDYNEFLASLPQQEGLTTIVKMIHSIAGKEGLSIKSASYSPSFKQSEKIRRYSISFPVTGNYKSIRKFIFNLEKMPYLMNIDSLDIKSNKKKTVSISLNMSLYFRADTI